MLFRRRRDPSALESAAEAAPSDVEAGPTADAEAGPTSELARTRRDLEVFTSSVARNFAKPMRSILSFASLLEQRTEGPGLDERSRHYLEEVVSATRRMKGMLDALVAFAGIESRPEVPKAVDATEVWNEARSAFGEEIARRGVDVTGEDLPLLSADRDQLRFVFEELLRNALKFGGEGLTRIRVSKQNGDLPPCITVADDGAGVPPGRTDVVVEMFGRLSRDRDEPGLGSGLALCRRIVERHGGRLWVESDGERGTSVHFTWGA